MRSWHIFSIAALLILQACASKPHSQPYSEQTRAKVVQVAKSQLGVRYKYGGSSPSKGFDCSGLVYYSHKKAGLTIPRDTRGQIKAMEKVRRSQLQPGDLLFYNISGNPRHVGIYIGNQQFIHAPSSGKKVTIEDMNTDYWRKRLRATGSYID